MKPLQITASFVTMLALSINAKGQTEPPSTGIALKAWLAKAQEQRPTLAEQAFANASLTKGEAKIAHRMLWDDLREALRPEREAEMKAEMISIADHNLRFDVKKFGDQSLYISMHGGGGTRPEINDKQWKNQTTLYKVKNGYYVSPRAPGNTWDLWHKAHVDTLLDRLIENFIIVNGIDPNKVYVLGYSAGGDGAFQLAPRMADRWAAAAMMAGHPGDAKPDNLRNIGFSLHMGGKDAAYDRNKHAAEWKVMLANLKTADPGGYAHEAHIYEDKGHWMDNEDASAIPWMAQFTRNPHPMKVVWEQDSVTHDRFYWLSVAQGTAHKDQRVVATIQGQTIQLDEVENLKTLTILLSDAMLDLDQEVIIKHGETQLFRGKVSRDIQSLHSTLTQRLDPSQQYCAKVTVSL
jgi:pimeloyl-ACP methyl ester carboxylesterase